MKQKIAATIAATIDLLLVALEGPDRNHPTESLSAVFLGASGICAFIGWISVIFSEGLEAFKGPTTRGGYVDVPTPGIFFIVFGWTMLLIPFVAWVIVLMSR